MKKTIRLFAFALGIGAVPSLVNAQEPPASAAPAAAAAPSERDPSAIAARAHFAANARAYGLVNPSEELQLRAIRAGRGVNHVRFVQRYRGLPVFGGEAIAHIDARGGIRVDNAIRGNLNVDVTPRVLRQVAIESAVRRAAIRGSYEVQYADLKVIAANEWNPRPAIAWHVRVHAENDLDIVKQWDVFINAGDGTVMFAFDSLHTATPGPNPVTGNTMWNGTVTMPGLFYLQRYWLFNQLQSNLNTRNMNNGTSGNGQVMNSTTSTFGNGSKSNSDRNTAGADAHYGAAKTWEYFQTTFGRNGIDGNGRTAFSRVHYSTNYENAFWDNGCFCMTYGDGRTTFFSLTSLDVAAHEMAHGVLSTEANLNYFGESGGLNESNSDIFGAMVEYFANNSADTPDYWIGERIYRANWPTDTTYVQTKALRYMDDPFKDSRSPACWSSSLGNLDVHYSSGPNNHMFYLLAEGGTSKCNGNQVTGIGRAKASAIWYNAIANYMTATTNYAGARAACINSATELYGAGSPEVAAVAAAYSAINRN